MKKLISGAVAVILCMALTTAASATTINGPQQSWGNGDGRTYTNYATVGTMATSSGVRATAVITASTTLPASRIGAMAVLLDANGSSVERSSMEYNSANTSSKQTLTLIHTYYGNYKGAGQTDVWNEKTNKYVGTACKTTSSLAFFGAVYAQRNIFNDPALEALMANEDGIERGTFDQVTFGTRPRLIRAIGSNGAVGYVLCTELIGAAANPAEAAIQMSARSSASKPIPLYAADGTTVIGEFV